ncbi:MAG: GTPase domain-containing protein, partial [bacterium]
DFLPLDLGQIKGFNTKFQLYTVPGQVFYNATRRLVLRGVDGIVFVADSQRSRFDENLESLKDMRDNLASYGYDLKSIPWVIQYNKRDLPDINSIEELQEAINLEGVPFKESVASEGVGVKETLKLISREVLVKLKDLSLEQPRQLVKGKPTTEEGPVAGDAGSAETAGKAGGSSTTSPFPTIRIRQRCDVHWKGMRIGNGLVEFANDAESKDPRDYLLTGKMSLLMFKKVEWKKALRLEGKNTRVFDDQEVETHFFMVRGETPEVAPKGLNLWVTTDRVQLLYGRYQGAFGQITVTPEGKKGNF